MTQHKLSTPPFPRITRASILGACQNRFWFWLAAVWIIPLMAGCQQDNLPAIVLGGSMAPNFLGDHYRVQCRDCGYEFAVGQNKATRDQSEESRNVVCPNCGYAKSRLLESDKRTSRVYEVKPAHVLRRWDVVAFQFDGEPSEQSKLGVKRIVGLPGETVEIADGEIWVNGAIARKSLAQQLSIAVPVFDSAYCPKNRPEVPSRFRIEPDNGLLNLENGTIQMRTTENNEPIQLHYTHWAGYRHGEARFQPIPIKDDYCHNAFETRKLNDIHEILVQAKLSLEEGSAEFRFALSEPELVCRLDARSGRIQVDCGPRIHESISWEIPPNSFELAISNIDDQIIVSIDGQVKFQKEFVTGLAADSAAVVHPLSVRLERGAVTISRLQIFRDLYYFDFVKGRDVLSRELSRYEYVLGGHEYLLLGDNVPQSADSRTWVKHGVPRSKIVGLIDHRDFHWNVGGSSGR